MQRTVLILKCALSCVLGLVSGYLIGMVIVSQLKTIPFIRIGAIEMCGNLPGGVLAIVLGFLSARSTYKAHIKKLSSGQQTDG